MDNNVNNDKNELRANDTKSENNIHKVNAEINSLERQNTTMSVINAIFIAFCFVLIIYIVCSRTYSYFTPPLFFVTLAGVIGYNAYRILSARNRRLIRECLLTLSDKIPEDDGTQ